MPATQTIQDLQAQIQALESPTSVNAAAPAAQRVTSGASTASATALDKLRNVASSSIGQNAPGWVILGVGLAGYLMSETRVIGPLFTIVIMVATIFQLNQYIKRKGSFFGNVLSLPPGGVVTQ